MTASEGRDPDCLFCRIVAGEVPSSEVTSSPTTYAFRDIQPTAPTHVLAEMIATAQEVTRMEGIGDRGYRLVFNVGPDALNSVPHLHLHVIGGRRMGWPPG